MMLQALDGSRECPDDVKVRGLGGKDGGHRCICRLAIESRASDAGAGQEVSDGLHGVGIMVADSRPTARFAA